MNAWFGLDTDVYARCAVDICDCHVYVCIENSDTSLLLFLKGRVDGMF